jgi:pimeloyl-ACP methyl ester carboxylesterase
VAVSVLFALVTSWRGIWGSHPAYWITLLVGLVGAGAIGVWAWLTHPSEDRPRWVRIVSRVLLVGAALMTVGIVVYLRPLGADDVAIAALHDGNGVDVSVSATRIRLQPTGAAKRTGLVFYPGAKVDPRAYTRILRPLAEAGYPVVVIKFPYNLAVFGISSADDVVGADDAVDRWVIGGHSLGGAMAASYASHQHRELAGLLLWAAYPASSMANRTGLDVLSVSGTNDGLATPSDIADSKANLPADAQFVAVQGGIHAFFGDYGAQSGDGTATVPREDAQRQIVEATLTQLARLDS